MPPFCGYQMLGGGKGQCKVGKTEINWYLQL